MQVVNKIWNWFLSKKDIDEWEEYKARKLEEINATKKEVGGYGDAGIVHKGQVVDYTKFLRRGGINRKIGGNQAPTTARPDFTPPPQNPTIDFKKEINEK